MRLRNGLIVVLLACALSACDSLSRYLAGMDDPSYFTWERSAAAREQPSPAATPTPPNEARQPLSALIGAATLAPPETPVPRESPAPSASPAQDLRDCEAPTLHGRDEHERGDAPTIARSENSPVVAECMAEKGYRKVYRPLSELF